MESDVPPSIGAPPFDFVASPNYDAGRTAPISRIVVHDTEGGFEPATNWFLSPASKVSAHYLIGIDGFVRQFVLDEDTAWHCGFPVGSERLYTGLWGNVSTNACSVGIELEGFSGHPYTDAQYDSLIWLCGRLVAAYNIPVDRLHIVAHSELSTAKRDPGPTFDWPRLMDAL